MIRAKPRQEYDHSRFIMFDNLPESIDTGSVGELGINMKEVGVLVSYAEQVNHPHSACEQAIVVDNIICPAIRDAFQYPPDYDNSIRHRWTCPECDEVADMHPSDYASIGTPMCPEHDIDMIPLD